MALTQEELRVVLKTVDESSVPLKRVRQEVIGLRKETEKPGKSITGQLGLSGNDLVRGGAALVGLSAGLNLAAGAAGHLHDALVGSVGGARDFGESVNKVEVVLGDASKSVKTFAGTSAASLGISRNEALAAAGSFGALFTTMGAGKSKAAAMSIEITKLAGDLASFHNIAPEVALEKLRSGLVGETEPLRALNVVINETQVQTKALAMGLAKSTDSISESAKMAARYALIMEQTKSAQGDFAKTSGSLANQERILAKETANLGQEFGALLLPVAQASTKIGIDMVRALRGFGDALERSRKARAEFIRDARTIAANPTDPGNEEQRLAALREAGVIFDEQRGAVDAITGATLTQKEFTDRVHRAAANVAEQQREIVDLHLTTVDALDQEYGSILKVAAANQKIVSAAMDYKKVLGDVAKGGAARLSLIDLDTEEKLLPITLKRIVLERQSADDRAKLLDLTNQITDAQQERLDLTIREANLTLEEIPAKQRLAELDRQITDSTDKRLSLQLRLRELLERQASAPGRNALEDLRFEREDTLSAYRTGGISRADARAKLMDLKKAEPGLEREVALSDRRLQLIGREQTAEEIRSELARLGLEQEQIEERRVLDQLGRKRDALDTEKAVHAANTTLKVADLERERRAVALVVTEHDKAIDALDREVKLAESLALAFKAMVSPEILDARRRLLEMEIQSLETGGKIAGGLADRPVDTEAIRSGASGGTSNPANLSATVNFYGGVTIADGTDHEAFRREIVSLVAQAIDSVQAPSPRSLTGVRNP